jgi:hypothetical protein
VRRTALAAFVLLVLGACTNGPSTSQNPLVPPGAHDLATGAACDNDGQCAGGVCLGVSGLEAGNPRFAAGYCTTVGCIADSQDGCGPDEWCVDFGSGSTYCLEMCSKADGLECARDDHVCIGLGVWGGCMSVMTVECDSSANVGCDDGELCVRIGFDDRTLGRCEALCDPFSSGDCGDNACYYIRRYDDAFCGIPGTTAVDEPCSCDKCCTPGNACTPDPDGAGKHCKPYCHAGGSDCSGGTCTPVEDGAYLGGCIMPGSPGT